MVEEMWKSSTMLLNFFIWITLFLSFHTAVMENPGKYSWERNQKERLLHKFLTDVKSYLIQNCSSTHMTIIAPNNRLLRTAKPIFKYRHHFVGTNSKVLIRSREHANRNCVFVFIDTIDYDYLATLFSDLPSDYNTKVQIFSINNLLKDEVKNTLYSAFDKSMENVTITFLENKKFKAFQMYPFTRNCKKEIRLSYVWVPDKGLETYYYDGQSPRNLNNCPVPISTLPFEHTIRVRENPNGTLTILDGLEGNLILSFAKKLNFIPVLRYPEIREWERIVNNTVVGLVGDIVNEKSVIAIGQLIPTLGRLKYGDLTTDYDHACIVWHTPAITGSADDVLYTEFNMCLWVAYVLSIIFSCVFVYNLSRISSNSSERQTYIGIALQVICATLGIPFQRLPNNRSGKIYFLFYIFYSTVMITAYQTSLASILTVKKDVQLIKTEADIVRSKLMTGGGNIVLSILKSQQAEIPYMSYLIENFEISVNTMAALDRVKRKKDFAFTAGLSELQYYKRKLIITGKEVYFYSFEKCILSYHKTILVRKGSALTNELNDIIKRLREFGLLNLWIKSNSDVDIQKVRESDMKLEKLKLRQLKSLFMVYLSGIILSSFVMLLEIIFGAQSRKKKSK